MRLRVALLNFQMIALLKPIGDLKTIWKGSLCREYVPIDGSNQVLLEKIELILCKHTIFKFKSMTQMRRVCIHQN